MLDAITKQARQRPIYLATLLTALITIPFLIAPELDIWVTSLFHDAADGFWLKSLYFPYRLRRLGIASSRIIIILLVLFVLARLFWPDLKKLFSLKPVLYLIAVAGIGPGLIVNGLLKAGWGRARPVQTDLFGGAWPYSEVWVVAGNCQNNCSFVSGEGAMSFWMLGLLLLVPLGWRKVSFWILAAFVIAISFNRIIFGGHYLSDILLSWAITAWTMALLSVFLRKHSPLYIDNAHLEMLWDRWGASLRHHLQPALSDLAKGLKDSFKAIWGFFEGELTDIRNALASRRNPDQNEKREED
ncbi:PAP2 superfamily protein [Cohaesibacter sp. ES.047]|uniref:phosphatase PAP2 family protein n=1 Tax=Cohaesibacter sp. ES.047 TaxID=1798205 RepID=UPI000BC02FC9|nr:phosphatase PAP2 family protein [Cohaesibacter sp. ES.047]SNY90622.1 PAP2 superfamily protein [Cohaesibacter sp. ES.047]